MTISPPCTTADREKSGGVPNHELVNNNACAASALSVDGLPRGSGAKKGRAETKPQGGGKIARTSKHYTICPHCGHGYIRAGICRGWMTCCICRLPMKVVK